MALAPGVRLGPYEVIAQIGVGGMGEVYRARDTKLDRDVAIKVLPESLAKDPERIARFQREAKTLASLNHPNIAAIYGLEEADKTTALVMELVEGPTLADRIAKGAIPIDEALPIAKQIAEALEAAHEQGIIHRDLKPANIKLRPDGVVKVLDFGLAKALEPTGAMSPGDDGFFEPHGFVRIEFGCEGMMRRHRRRNEGDAQPCTHDQRCSQNESSHHRLLLRCDRRRTFSQPATLEVGIASKQTRVKPH